MAELRTDLAIIGSSISANMAAAYLKKEMPSLKISVIGPKENSHPIVGESLTEYSTQFFREIGMGNILEENHLHKYGLTFYFKKEIDKPSERSYFIHEAPGIPPMPSNLINRFEFDRELKERNQKAGVKYYDSLAKSIEIGDQLNHRIELKDQFDTKLKTRWIIDASGRNRVLAKKQKLNQKAPHQRSTFWFRLEGFDKKILSTIDMVKKEQLCFDSYLVTHHFMGRGNWVWLIPMKDQEGKELISIGIVMRPDLYQGSILNIEQFKSAVSTEHPVITELVESGKILDTNTYRNYMYESKQVYSKKGWFIIGDAGFTVDPLYSTGLVLTSIQIKQIAKLIDSKDREKLIPEFERAFIGLRKGMQTEISELYQKMHCPYECHWRVHLSSAFYFYCLLPLWLAGYMYNRSGARLVIKILESSPKKIKSLYELLEIGKTVQTKHLQNKYNTSVNWNLFGANEVEIPSHLSKLSFLLASYRFKILSQAKFHSAPKHLSRIFLDFAQGLLLKIFFRKATLKKHFLVRLFVLGKVSLTEETMAYNTDQEKSERQDLVNS